MKKKIGISMLAFLWLAIVVIMIYNIGWAGVAILGLMAYILITIKLLNP